MRHIAICALALLLAGCERGPMLLEDCAVSVDDVAVDLRRPDGLDWTAGDLVAIYGESWRSHIYDLNLLPHERRKVVDAWRECRS